MLTRLHALWGAVVLVAAAQLALVHGGGLTRWKGGGFGMYTEAHPNERQVVLRGLGGAPIPGHELARSGCRAPVRRFQRWPSADAAASVAGCVPLAVTAVELWSPGVDPATGRLTLREVARHDLR